MRIICHQCGAEPTLPPEISGDQWRLDSMDTTTLWAFVERWLGWGHRWLRSPQQDELPVLFCKKCIAEFPCRVGDESLHLDQQPTHPLSDL
jgi:hypothetical protein